MTEFNKLTIKTLRCHAKPEDKLNVSWFTDKGRNILIIETELDDEADGSEIWLNLDSAKELSDLLLELLPKMAEREIERALGIEKDESRWIGN
jgi:hypothetical protein